MKITVREVCENLFDSYGVIVKGCYNGKILARNKKSAIDNFGDKEVEHFSTRISVSNKHNESFAHSELMLWVSNYQEEMKKMQHKPR